jgi:Protein of unknown function (DUF3307)
MTWPALFGACLLAHLVGDFLLQTDWQAKGKKGGLGRDPTARRALFSHLLTYTLAFLPVFVWIGMERSVLGAVGIAALVFLPHLVVDDRRLLMAYIRAVKGVQAPVPTLVFFSVDQSVHVLSLAAVALLATS